MSFMETPFTSESDADAAYYGSGDGGGDGGGGSGVGGAGGGGTAEDWGAVEAIEQLAGGWVLGIQQSLDGTRERWFVFTATENRTLFLNRSGKEEEFGMEPDTNLVPSFDTETEAREAHERWLEDHPEVIGGGEEGGAGENGWSAWELVTEVAPWFIYGRQHADGRIEYLVSGVIDGANVYLHPDGFPYTEAHVYTSTEGVDGALAAYFELVDMGEIPEEQQPTGQEPDADGFPSGSTAGEGPEGGLMETLAANPLLVVGGVGAGIYILHKSSDGGNGGIQA